MNRNDVAEGATEMAKTGVKTGWHLLRRLTRARDLRRLVGDGSERPVQLLLGAGKQRRPGWIATDVFPRGWDVLLLDVTKRFPFPDGAVQRIFAEHVIEHVPIEAGEAFLQEAFRVLRSGGRIRIATPDVRRVGRLLSDEIDDVSRRYVQECNAMFLPEGSDLTSEPLIALNRIFSGHGHCFLYDEALLGRLLSRHGFVGITRCQVGVSDDPEFTDIEDHGRHIGDFCNDYETMVIEATRP